MMGPLHPLTPSSKKTIGGSVIGEGRGKPYWFRVEKPIRSKRLIQILYSLKSKMNATIGNAISLLQREF